MTWGWSSYCCRGPGYEYAAVPEPLAGWDVSYVVVPPGVEPLTLEEVKLFHRIDQDVEDAEITRLIKSARQWVEQWLGSSLITQTREINLRQYYEGIRLPYGPVQEVVSVSESAPYLVQYVAGYPAAGEDSVGNVPEPIKTAMQLLIGDVFENRENTVIGTITTSLQFALEAHLWPYRLRGGFA